MEAYLGTSQRSLAGFGAGDFQSLLGRWRLWTPSSGTSWTGRSETHWPRESSCGRSGRPYSALDPKWPKKHGGLFLFPWVPSRIKLNCTHGRWFLLSCVPAGGFLCFARSLCFLFWALGHTTQDPKPLFLDVPPFPRSSERRPDPGALLVCWVEGWGSSRFRSYKGDRI